MIKEVKNTVPWTHAVNDFNGKELLERFMKNNCEKQTKKNLE